MNYFAYLLPDHLKISGSCTTSAFPVWKGFASTEETKLAVDWLKDEDKSKIKEFRSSMS